MKNSKYKTKAEFLHSRGWDLVREEDNSINLKTNLPQKVYYWKSRRGLCEGKVVCQSKAIRYQWLADTEVKKKHKPEVEE